MKRELMSYLKTYWWKFLILVFAIGLDLFTKNIFVPNNQEKWREISILGDILVIHPTTNIGAGFSILEGKTWFLILVTFIFLVGFSIFDLKYKTKSTLFGIATALIISGAIGNLIDRIFLGYVRDFIFLKFINFPIFNIADVCLCVGVFLVFLYVIIVLPKEDKYRKMRNGINSDVPFEHKSDFANNIENTSFTKKTLCKPMLKSKLRVSIKTPNVKLCYKSVKRK